MHGHMHHLILTYRQSLCLDEKSKAQGGNLQNTCNRDIRNIKEIQALAFCFQGLMQLTISLYWWKQRGQVAPIGPLLLGSCGPVWATTMSTIHTLTPEFPTSSWGNRKARNLPELLSYNQLRLRECVQFVTKWKSQNANPLEPYFPKLTASRCVFPLVVQTP